MLTLHDQKNRLANMLGELKNIRWQENKGERYRVMKPGRYKGSLWLRITKGNETIVLSTTGDVTATMETSIIKLIGSPRNTNGGHRDWFNVDFEKARHIAELFNSE